MPTIVFHSPKLTDAQKKEAIQRFTEAGSAVTGIDEKNFVVYLEEKDPGNVGVGGEVLKDLLQRQ